MPVSHVSRCDHVASRKRRCSRKHLCRVSWRQQSTTKQQRGVSWAAARRHRLAPLGADQQLPMPSPGDAAAVERQTRRPRAHRPALHARSRQAAPTLCRCEAEEPALQAQTACCRCRVAARLRRVRSQSKHRKRHGCLAHRQANRRPKVAMQHLPWSNEAQARRLGAIHRQVARPHHPQERRTGQRLRGCDEASQRQRRHRQWRRPRLSWARHQRGPGACALQAARHSRMAEQSRQRAQQRPQLCQLCHEWHLLLRVRHQRGCVAHPQRAATRQSRRQMQPQLQHVAKSWLRRNAAPHRLCSGQVRQSRRTAGRVPQQSRASRRAQVRCAAHAAAPVRHPGAAAARAFRAVAARRRRCCRHRRCCRRRRCCLCRARAASACPQKSASASRLTPRGCARAGRRTCGAACGAEACASAS